jgi:Protein involved in initiation of plasmid replication
MAQIKDEAADIQRRIGEYREYKVVKSNDLIQKSRFQLSSQEQKIILYLISKIKPKDMVLKEHTFEIRDFCKICGLETNSGANYKYIKQTMKDLRDRSIWVTLENGSETTLAWIDKVTMNKQSGAVIIKIDEMMKPYLLQLQERFTQYELLYTLAMRSQYSIRLYELLKSYEYQRRKIFDLEKLKHMLSAENYGRYPDFKRKVLDIAMREINDLSDLAVTYEIIKKGRKYAQIEFSMRIKKDMDERLRTWAKIDEVINPAQLSLFEKINGEKL